MDILFDEEQLLQLVTNLYVLTGLTANILDPQGRDIHLFKDHPPFCRAVNDLPEGHQRCVDCDMWKVRNYTAEKGFQLYRCHAGGHAPLRQKKSAGLPDLRLLPGRLPHRGPVGAHPSADGLVAPGAGRAEGRFFSVPPVFLPGDPGLRGDVGGPVRLHPPEGHDPHH